jgi:hypothetical protein
LKALQMRCRWTRSLRRRAGRRKRSTVFLGAMRRGALRFAGRCATVKVD